MTAISHIKECIFNPNANFNEDLKVMKKEIQVIVQETPTKPNQMKSPPRSEDQENKPLWVPDFIKTASEEEIKGKIHYFLTL